MAAMPRRTSPESPGVRLARLLGGAAPPPDRSAELDVDLDALVVDVAGVGRLGAPVPPAQARKLIALAAPAPYGRGEETLHDVRVRDTWQVPTDLVAVDFGDHLGELLEAARDALGMPEGSSLSMDLHSLLVYEKGQFFLPHQDSEKDDAMVGTVVVALPSRHTGGELVIHEGGRDAAYRGSPSETSAVAFFADQVHEVRPVRSGYRVALTYNLLVTDQPDPAPVEDEVGQAAQLLRRYFATPVSARWSGDTTEPPLRYAYLLDHQYTQRGLGWSRLKGDDLERAGVLRAAAERLGCEAMLALTDIHEVWDAGAGDWRRRWRDDSDEVELGSLMESEVVLTHWLAPGDRSAKPVCLALDGREVGATTPTASLAPYDSQYEGYMGNYGNTVDRWYHRAAVVVWPAQSRLCQPRGGVPSLGAGRPGRTGQPRSGGLHLGRRRVRGVALAGRCPVGRRQGRAVEGCAGSGRCRRRGRCGPAARAVRAHRPHARPGAGPEGARWSPWGELGCRAGGSVAHGAARPSRGRLRRVDDDPAGPVRRPCLPARRCRAHPLTGLVGAGGSRSRVGHVRPDPPCRCRTDLAGRPCGVAAPSQRCRRGAGRHRASGLGVHLQPGDAAPRGGSRTGRRSLARRRAAGRPGQGPRVVCRGAAQQRSSRLPRGRRTTGR